MDKNVYFALMRETSDIADEAIISEIKSKYSGKICETLVELPQKRAQSGRPKLRPAILRFSYEISGGKEWKKLEKAAAAVEMLSLSTYVLNYVFDDKGGIKSKQQRNNECMAAMILRELSQKMIRDVYAGIDTQRALEIDRRFSEINEYTSGIGQYLDGNMLREIGNNYLDTYVQRCLGLTGVFMQNTCAIGGLLAGASEEKVEKLSEYGRNLGIVVQMMNDLGDFLPQKAGMHSVGRVHQDQYSDLKHGCITFPAYHVLIEGNEQERESVNKVKGYLDAAEEDCLNVTSSFIRSNGIKEMKKLGSLYAKKAKDALEYLEPSQAKSFLAVALTVSRYNKYYDSFKELELKKSLKYGV